MQEKEKDRQKERGREIERQRESKREIERKEEKVIVVRGQEIGGKEKQRKQHAL